MPPGEEEGDEHGCTVPDHPPAAATVRSAEDALPHSTPLLRTIAPVDSQEKRQRHDHEQQSAVSIPEGPLIEILARVPYRSLCRFKCVSKPWLALCSSRDIYKRSPQTLSGFFYYHNKKLSFRNLSGSGPSLVDPSLPFLLERYEGIAVQEFCGSLLLCRCWKSCSMEEESDYAVCNPATEEWTVLPPILHPGQESSFVLGAYLGFDAAVPSRFVVFATLASRRNDSEQVAIYSSETRQWTYVQSKWPPRTAVAVHLDFCPETHVFLNGTMHWYTDRHSIATVDSEGTVWWEIKMPDDMPNNFDIISVGRPEGRLYVSQIDTHDWQLYIWVLEDYGTGKWILKHTINVLELFGRHGCEDDTYYAYSMFAFHPDCNVIFLTDMKKMTLSYNLDNHKVDVICTESMYGKPYIPCFAEFPSAGH